MMYSTEQFVDYIVQELSNRGVNGQWGAQQIAGAIQRVLQPPVPPLGVAMQVTEDTIISIPNHILIHEMLKRGFAVSKIPDQKEVT